MKIKEAIAILKHLKDDLHLLSEEYVECFSMAISALEKQEGKKIAIDTTDEREFFDHVCPNCRTTLQQYRKGQTRLTYKPDYCNFCGQKIDWSE